ncbi:uncharacterized protein LOC112087152 [Eutrema salsugineum]|uniref:uncharacterized protein LOC112087152 n=1 Tax=Eutrema salsugineum TaxID=72664 RepID=UPI000CED1EB4|nr:uncharacterized protein LOC112087152 [Eutrema salsugineum]
MISVESMSIKFPASSEDTFGISTLAMLDMEDFEIPDPPSSIEGKIREYLAMEGYLPLELTMKCVCADENNFTEESWMAFEEARIYPFLTLEDDELSRLSMILVDSLFWADTEGEGVNVLIISKHIQKHPLFSKFRLLLEERGGHVAVAPPETVLNLDVDEAKIMSNYRRSSASFVTYYEFEDNRDYSKLFDSPPSGLSDPLEDESDLLEDGELLSVSSLSDPLEDELDLDGEFLAVCLRLKWTREKESKRGYKAKE